jgi:hypothetical protein
MHTSSAVVFGSATPFGRRVAQALEHVGIEVVAIDVDLDDRAAVARALSGEMTAVVYAHVDPQCLAAQAFVEVDPVQWDAQCEKQLRMFLHVVQASYASLARSRGALGCVCP